MGLKSSRTANRDETLGSSEHMAGKNRGTGNTNGSLKYKKGSVFSAQIGRRHQLERNAKQGSVLQNTCSGQGSIGTVGRLFRVWPKVKYEETSDVESTSEKGPDNTT
jgi:hypothetical protein